MCKGCGANEQREGGEDFGERVGFRLGKGERFGKRAREGWPVVLENDVSDLSLAVSICSLPGRSQMRRAVGTTPEEAAFGPTCLGSRRSLPAVPAGA
jgi:hypothetical protein